MGGVSEADGVPIAPRPPVPGWLPFLTGSLLLYTGLVREYLAVGAFSYGGVDGWIFDLTRHVNLFEVALGVAILVPMTRSMAAVALVVFASASMGIVLHLKFNEGLDISRLPLFGPCELPFAGQVAVNLGLCGAAAWILARSPVGPRYLVPAATAVPLTAALAFLLTALMKVEDRVFPSGCLFGEVDGAGVFHEDPLVAWLQGGTMLAIPLELAVAWLLFHRPTRRWGARVGGGFLLLGASALTTVALVSGKDPTRYCGCFGPLELPLGAHLFVDGVMGGLLFWTYRLTQPTGSDGNRR